MYLLGRGFKSIDLIILGLIVQVSIIMQNIKIIDKFFANAKNVLS